MDSNEETSKYISGPLILHQHSLLIYVEACCIVPRQGFLKGLHQ
jgi:hypothetical protein